MKKLTMLGVLFLCITILFSCSDDKKSKKDKKNDKFKKELKEPCDFIDHALEIFEDLTALSSNYNDISDLNDNDKKKVDECFEELEDACKYAYKNFDKDDLLDDDAVRGCEKLEEYQGFFSSNAFIFYEEGLKDYFELMDNLEKELREKTNKDYNNKRPKRYS